MENGLTKAAGGAAWLGAILTIASFLAPGAAFSLALIAAALRAFAYYGLARDGALSGRRGIRNLAYVLSAAELMVLIFTAVGIPVEAHFGVDGYDSVSTGGVAGVVLGFVLWFLYGAATFVLGVQAAKWPRHLWFGIFMIAAGLCWISVLVVLAWPFVVAAALAFLGYALIRKPHEPALA